MTKIIDCFLINQEINTLEFRLKELWDVVDFFFIVQCKKDFNNLPKPLVTEDKRFDSYRDKMVVYTLEDFPDKTELVKLTNRNCYFKSKQVYQRSMIGKVVEKIPLSDSDIIYFSDADEIPNSETLITVKEKGLDGIYNVPLECYYYNFNNFEMNPDCQWQNYYQNRAKIMDVLTFKKMLRKNSLENIRKSAGKNKGNLVCKPGWHLWMFEQKFMNPEDIPQRYISWRARDGLNNEKFQNVERIKNNFEEGKYMWFERNPEIKVKFIPIEENNNLPKNFNFWL